mgnify:CR=1 FL=1
MIIKECKKCGAPLVQRGEDLYCEYCRASYKLPRDYNDQPKSFSQNNPYPNNTFPNIPTNLEPSLSPTPPRIPPKKKNALGCIIFILLAVIGVAIWQFLGLSSNKKTIMNVDPNQQIEAEMFRRNSSALPDRYPAGFVHNDMLSIGVILDSVSYDDFQLRVFVKNKLDRTIVANLKTDQMKITDAKITDSLGNQYTCEINEKFTNTDEMKSDDVGSIADMYCRPGFFPSDVKYISVDLTFTNWGKYSFQIPLDLDMSKLTINYNLSRSNNMFVINTSIFSSVPQFISLKLSDISVIDNKGKQYSFDNCSSGNDTLVGYLNEHSEYYVALADEYDPGSFFDCTYNQPIPDDVNSLTFIINIRGNTVTNTFITDTVQ